jgi:hypothetical protein
MWAFKCILFYILFFSSTQASMASNSDSDDSSVAMEIDFTIPGQTRTWPVGQDPDLLSSPPSPKESKEEQRKRKQRENAAKRRAAKKPPPKKKLKAAKKTGEKERIHRHQSKKRAKSDSLAQERQEAQIRQREMAKRQADFAKRREATRQKRILEAEADNMNMNDRASAASSTPSTRLPAPNRPPCFHLRPTNLPVHHSHRFP